jgi:hypothetical protein
LNWAEIVQGRDGVRRLDTCRRGRGFRRAPEPTRLEALPEAQGGEFDEVIAEGGAEEGGGEVHRKAFEPPAGITMQKTCCQR